MIWRDWKVCESFPTKCVLWHGLKITSTPSQWSASVGSTMRSSTLTYHMRRSSKFRDKPFTLFYKQFFKFRTIVEDCRDTFLSAIPEAEKSSLRWEHVGSTSIKGMPGTKMPDSLLIVPEFPPSMGVIQAFLDSGYYFSSSSSLDVKDLWWFLVFHEGNYLELSWICS